MHHPTITILGAGHAGTALAAYLALNGSRVCLYNRSARRLALIAKDLGIRYSFEDGEAVTNGFAPISVATDCLKTALDFSDLVIVTMPAFAHAEIAQACAPLIHSEKLLVLSPGRTGGALEFFRSVNTPAPNPFVSVAEIDTFILAARVLETGIVLIRGKKKSAKASLKRSRICGQLDRNIIYFKSLFPEIAFRPSVIETSLSNVGSLLHSSIGLLNLGRIDSPQAFEFYYQGLTPSVSKVLAALDRERVQVADAYGFQIPSITDWMNEAYARSATNLLEAVRDNPSYRKALAPSTLIGHRYLEEDVPFGLVPMSLLAGAVDVQVPTLNALIDIASTVAEKDFRSTGRTMARMGLSGRSASEILSYCSGE